MKTPSGLKALLERRVDPNLPDWGGGTPLHTAENPTMAQILLDYGADPQITNKVGETPLETTDPVVRTYLLDRLGLRQQGGHRQRIRGHLQPKKS